MIPPSSSSSSPQHKNNSFYSSSLQQQQQQQINNYNGNLNHQKNYQPQDQKQYYSIANSSFKSITKPPSPTPAPQIQRPIFSTTTIVSNTSNLVKRESNNNSNYIKMNNSNSKNLVTISSQENLSQEYNYKDKQVMAPMAPAPVPTITSIIKKPIAPVLSTNIDAIPQSENVHSPAPDYSTSESNHSSLNIKIATLRRSKLNHDTYAVPEIDFVNVTQFDSAPSTPAPLPPSPPSPAVLAAAASLLNESSTIITMSSSPVAPVQGSAPPPAPAPPPPPPPMPLIPIIQKKEEILSPAPAAPALPKTLLIDTNQSENNGALSSPQPTTPPPPPPAPPVPQDGLLKFTKTAANKSTNIKTNNNDSKTDNKSNTMNELQKELQKKLIDVKKSMQMAENKQNNVAKALEVNESAQTNLSNNKNKSSNKEVSFNEDHIVTNNLNKRISENKENAKIDDLNLLDFNPNETFTSKAKLALESYKTSKNSPSNSPSEQESANSTLETKQKKLLTSGKKHAPLPFQTNQS